MNTGGRSAAPVRKDVAHERGADTAPAAPDHVTYFFDPVVVKIRNRSEVWTLTPHGQTLGEGMVFARHALIGQAAIEFGAGTGVHAIAALKLGARSIDVTDIVPSALEACTENAALNDVRLGRMRCADWLDFPADQSYDTVICNPPFCKAGTPDRRWFIRTLIAESPRFLWPGGHLLFVQSSMADFAETERELADAGYLFTRLHERRYLFRAYYFQEPGFVEESRLVAGGFDVIDGACIETLRVYLCTRP